jgi:hypothetical protein
VSEFFSALWELLVPPLDAEHEKQYGWRVRMAIIAASSFFGLIAVSALALGMAAWTGFEGFARASETQVIIGQLKDLRAGQIEESILQLRIKHCEADSAAAKQLYWERIAELMTKYQQITGRVYSLPACSDL